MEAEGLEDDVCEDCGEPVYGVPAWSLDIVLCKSCWILRRQEEDE